MCAVSMIHDFAKKWYEKDTWTKPKLDDYKEIVRRLDEIDKKLGLEACEPNKAEFIQEIEDRLTSIEEGLKPKKRSKNKPQLLNE